MRHLENAVAKSNLQCDLICRKFKVFGNFPKSFFNIWKTFCLHGLVILYHWFNLITLLYNFFAIIY